MPARTGSSLPREKRRVEVIKRLQSYVVKEVLKAFLPALLVLTLIIALGLCVQLLHEGLDVVRLRGLPGYILSYSIPMVLPSAFVTAVIMAFGRLSADNEITAIRVSGIHLFSIVLPVFAIAFVLSGVVAYFQFQVMPKARGRIDMLKYEAMKQILIENVALSAQRQFSFSTSLSSCHILYEGFQDGEMSNLLIVEARNDAPRVITTARRGSIVPDPQDSEGVLLKLRDCAVTWLAADERGGLITVTGEESELPIRLTPKIQDIRISPKYFGVRGLVGLLNRLRRQVSAHSMIFPNPDKKGDEVRKELRDIDRHIAGLNGELGHYDRRLKKLREQDRRELTRTIELKQEEIRSLREQMDLLKAEQLSCMQEVEKLQKESGSEGATMSRIAELHKRVQEVKGKIEGLDAKIAPAEEEIKRAQAQIEKDEATAREYDRMTMRLQMALAEDAQERSRLSTDRTMAEIQEGLRSVEIRIHKRLAESLATVIFAMIGVPLGIMTRRRSIMIAIAISFALVLLVFYPLLVAGQILAELSLVPIVPAIWSGNVITFLIGLILTVNVVRK